MDFVFKNRAKISKTSVISFDNEYVYLWQPKSRQKEKYNLVKIPHKLKIDENWHKGWKAGLWIKEIEKSLPHKIRNANRFAVPCISGGLLTPFIALQKKKRISKYWPYTTRESYLATIIHEFGHVYWSQFKLWWPSNKRINIDYLKLAGSLYGNKTRRPKVEINFPQSSAVGEIFAFCTEYYASTLFWSNHKQNLDKFSHREILKLIKEESKKDLITEDSVLEPSRFPHNLAFVFGKIALSLYPTKWPSLLTNNPALR